MFESLNVAAVYAAMLATIGACTAIWLSLGARSTSGEHAAAAEPLRSLSVAAMISSALLWLLLVIRLISHSTAIFGIRDALTFDSLSMVAWKSRWGVGWREQVLAASVCVAAALWHARSRAITGRLMMTLAAIVSAITLPLSG